MKRVGKKMDSNLRRLDRPRSLKDKEDWIEERIMNEKYLHL